MIFTVGLLPPPGRGISIQNDRGKALPAAAFQQLYPAYRKARAEMQAYPVAQKAAAVLLEREKEQEVVLYLLSHNLLQQRFIAIHNIINNVITRDCFEVFSCAMNL